MLLKRRPPGVEADPPRPNHGLEHLEPNWIAVLRWLNVSQVDYIVVGPVGEAIRGDVGAKGAVAIVPAPYSRNFQRLATGLVAEHASLRVTDGARPAGDPDSAPIKLTADKLARGQRWMLRFGGYDLDVLGGRPVQGDPGPSNSPSYQELLYEAARFEIAPGCNVEVASPADLEHYAHLRRTGSAPEIRITRSSPTPPQTA
jgi:hypothetical protein